jgi:hypothetical protein
MYLFCKSRIHVITLYSGHVCVYYASMLWCWYLVWILGRTDHPYLGVGCYNPQAPEYQGDLGRPFPGSGAKPGMDILTLLGEDLRL